jgi:ribonuclease HI
MFARRFFSTVVVYCDGACKHNGVSQRAAAGFGVWFGDGDARNVSAVLPGEAQTNQRAELFAAIAALERVRSDVDVEIRSDSRYVVDGVKLWLPTWRSNGWTSSKGSTVANRDLWWRIDRLLQERSRLDRRTDFVHVRAHRGDEGNEKADTLATDSIIKR